ncbi:MAG: hypothetical protein FWE88_06525 [Phycisphaerae bacterium]|nr:hypothetical protein [Phycisphaerae bacterium]
MNKHLYVGLLAGLCLWVVAVAARADDVAFKSVRSAIPATMFEDQWNVRYVFVDNDGDTPADIRVRLDTNYAPIRLVSTDIWIEKAHTGAEVFVGEEQKLRIVADGRSDCKLSYEGDGWQKRVHSDGSTEHPVGRGKTLRVLRDGAMELIIEDKWTLRIPFTGDVSFNGKGVSKRTLADGTVEHSAADQGWKIRVYPNNSVEFADRGSTLGKTRFLLDGQVAPHSVRRFAMAVRPHAPEVAGTSLDLDSAEEIYILENSSARELSRFALLAVSRTGTFFMHSSTSDEGADLGYLVGWDRQNPEVLPDDDEKIRRNGVVGTQYFDMPDQAYAYNVAQMVVIAGTDMQRFRPAQWEALLNWVRAGGLLVLAGNSQLAGMLEGELGELAGVSVAGLHCISELRDVTDVRRNEMFLSRTTNDASRLVAARQAVTLPMEDRTIAMAEGPLPMVQLLPDTARVLYTANGMPLMTEQAVGNGHIVTLAVPTLALKFGPLPRLWTTVLEQRDTIASMRNDDLFLRSKSRREKSNALQATPTLTGGATAGVVLNRIAGRPGYARVWPVGILLTLTAGAVVVGGLLWFRRRGEWLWLMLLPVSVLAGGAMYVIGLSQTDPPRTSFIGLMTAAGDRHAVVQEVALYYSGPGQDVDRLGSDDVQSMVIPAVGSAGSGSLDLTRIRTNAPMSIVNVAPQPNQLYGYYMQSVIRSEGLSGHLTFGPAGVEGHVRNHLGAELKNPVLYVNLNTPHNPRTDGTLMGITGAANLLTRQAFRMADLPANAEMAVAATANTRLPDTDAFSNTRVDISSDEKNRAALLRQVVGLGEMVNGADPLVVGYVETSALIPQGHKPQGWRLVAWPVKLQAPPPGTAVHIPSAFTRMIVTGMSYRGGEFWQGTAFGGSGTFIVRPPRVIGDRLDNAAAHIRLDIQAPYHNVTLAGVTGFATDTLGQDHELDTFKNASGQYDVKVANAGAYYHPGLGYVFRLIVRPAVADAADLTTLWQTKHLEVSLEGTMPRE